MNLIDLHSDPKYIVLLPGVFISQNTRGGGDFYKWGENENKTHQFAGKCFLILSHFYNSGIFS